MRYLIYKYVKMNMVMEYNVKASLFFFVVNLQNLIWR